MVYKRLMLASLLFAGAASIKTMQVSVAGPDPLDAKASAWIKSNSGSSSFLDAVKMLVTTWPNYYFENQTKYPVQIGCAQIAKDKTPSFTLAPNTSKIIKGTTDGMKKGQPIGFGIYDTKYANADLVNMGKSERAKIAQVNFTVPDFDNGQVFVYHVLKQVGDKVYLYSYSDKGQRLVTDVSKVFPVAPAAKPATSPSSSSTAKTPSYTPINIDNLTIQDILAADKSNQVYKIYGLSSATPNATELASKKADATTIYKKLSLKFHPDKNKAPGAEEAFKAISNFYDKFK